MEGQRREKEREMLIMKESVKGENRVSDDAMDVIWISVLNK